MASSDDVYRKFGMAAEAAQVLETELSTLLLGVRGLANDWHIEGPEREAGLKAMAEIDSQTLGSMLKALRKVVQIDDLLVSKLTSALGARNLLTHGFFERHNFKMLSDDGRDAMIADLETLHDELLQGWQSASAMSGAFLSMLLHLKERGVEVKGIGDFLAEFSVKKPAAT